MTVLISIIFYNHWFLILYLLGLWGSFSFNHKPAGQSHTYKPTLYDSSAFSIVTSWLLNMQLML